LKTSVLGGESFWINTFTAKEAGELALTGVQLGDIDVLELKGDEMILQSGAYIASTEGTDIDTSWQGMRGLLGEGDIVMLKASGIGKVWISSFGALEKKELKAGEKLVLDTGHAVAFSGAMNYNVRKVGGLKSTFLSGEGLVFDFVGPGTLYIQSRILSGFARSLIPFLPKRSH
ncbi:MAG: TIGR00266 family protein, partial [Candidatus Hydrothermarchaeales archaeon]